MRDTTTFDTAGNILTDVDALGNKTTNTWDGNRLMSSVVADPNGNVISSLTNTYDENGTS